MCIVNTCDCHLDHVCQGCQVLPCCHQKILPSLNSSAAVASYSRLRWNKFFFSGTSLHRNELACLHLQHNAGNLNFVSAYVNEHLFFDSEALKLQKIMGKQKSCKARHIKIISPAFLLDGIPWVVNDLMGGKNGSNFPLARQQCWCNIISPMTAWTICRFVEMAREVAINFLGNPGWLKLTHEAYDDGRSEDGKENHIGLFDRDGLCRSCA